MPSAARWAARLSCSFFFLSGFEGLHFVDAHVGCGDQADRLDRRVLRAGVAGHESAHAVTDENDVARVGAKLFRVGGIAQIGDGGLCVFDGVGEGEVARRSPGPAVVEVDDVPAVAADGLRQVKILLITGEAVKQEDDWVWACSLGDVGEGVEHRSVAGNLEGLHRGGVGFVGGRIGGDRRGKFLGLKRKRSNEQKRGGRKKLVVRMVDCCWCSGVVKERWMMKVRR